MNVTVEIPDQVLRGTGTDMARQILETVAIEGFRSGKLTLFQVRKLLGLETRFEVHEFLSQHGVPWVNYSVEDLQRERESLRELLGR